MHAQLDYYDSLDTIVGKRRRARGSSLANFRNIRAAAGGFLRCVVGGEDGGLTTRDSCRANEGFNLSLSLSLSLTRARARDEYSSACRRCFTFARAYMRTMYAHACMCYIRARSDEVRRAISYQGLIVECLVRVYIRLSMLSDCTRRQNIDAYARDTTIDR